MTPSVFDPKLPGSLQPTANDVRHGLSVLAFQAPDGPAILRTSALQRIEFACDRLREAVGSGMATHLESIRAIAGIKGWVSMNPESRVDFALIPSISDKAEIRNAAGMVRWALNTLVNPEIVHVPTRRAAIEQISESMVTVARYVGDRLSFPDFIRLVYQAGRVGDNAPGHTVVDRLTRCAMWLNERGTIVDTPEQVQETFELDSVADAVIVLRREYAMRDHPEGLLDLATRVKNAYHRGHDDRTLHANRQKMSIRYGLTEDEATTVHQLVCNELYSEDLRDTCDITWCRFYLEPESDDESVVCLDPQCCATTDPEEYNELAAYPGTEQDAEESSQSVDEAPAQVERCGAQRTGWAGPVCVLQPHTVGDHMDSDGDPWRHEYADMDAAVRRYFERLTGQGKMIVMTAPAERSALIVDESSSRDPEAFRLTVLRSQRDAMVQSGRMPAYPGFDLIKAALDCTDAQALILGRELWEREPADPLSTRPDNCIGECCAPYDQEIFVDDEPFEDY